MSKVSGVTLIFKENDDDPHGKKLTHLLNTWMVEHRHPICFNDDLSEDYGGSKHPQHHTIGAGVNMLEEDEFAALVLRLGWDNPENVVLIIQPEEGPTRIWRIQ